MIESENNRVIDPQEFKQDQAYDLSLLPKSWPNLSSAKNQG
jgi:hypothetical protein